MHNILDGEGLLNKVPTKDNLVHKGVWLGSTSSELCKQTEESDTLILWLLYIKGSLGTL